MDDLISLIRETVKNDEYGVSRTILEYRDVFCKSNSVTRSEYYQAGRNGLNPEMEFTVNFAEYEGERSLLWNGQRYAIYRTYHQPGTDYMELYVRREGGTNGIE